MTNILWNTTEIGFKLADIFLIFTWVWKRHRSRFETFDLTSKIQSKIKYVFCKILLADLKFNNYFFVLAYPSKFYTNQVTFIQQSFDWSNIENWLYESFDHNCTQKKYRNRLFILSKQAGILDINKKWTTPFWHWA